jgi:hypothetical protein
MDRAIPQEMSRRKRTLSGEECDAATMESSATGARDANRAPHQFSRKIHASGQL